MKLHEWRWHLPTNVEAKVLPSTEWRAIYLSWGLTPRSAAAMAEMLNGFNTGWIAYEKGEAETTHCATPLESALSELIRRERPATRRDPSILNWRQM
jgi:hypothetical protein